MTTLTINGDNAEVPFTGASKGAAVHLCGPPESNFLVRLAPSKPARLVPFRAGANASLAVVPNRMIPSHSESELPDE